MPRRIDQERLALFRERAFAAGRHGGGRVPYGFYVGLDGRLARHEDEAAVVVTMYVAYLKLRSLERVCKALRVMGRTSRGGKEFKRATVRAILANPANVGDRRHAGGYVSGAHEGIVTRRRFNAAMQLMADNRRG